MIKVAILGFGVVGGGTAELLINNSAQVAALAGDEIEIKYILDLRDFPDSPLGNKVVHDFSIILNDPEVSVVMELMGGSHPAYEYTVAALRAGKSVVTSNKEVVSKYGDEFLATAAENGVCYRFEAAVGGGIPLLSPIISCIKQNKISEVRGILNGTTNFILTEMFTYGKSFDDALADAKARGYAEADPSADILGTDACRKIAILTALVTGKLIPTENIHTEGITAIRKADVMFAQSRGCTVKLVARCMVENGTPLALVAPFLVPQGMPLSGVNGVYNAVEVIADPLGNVMFYGQGAGAGATASAVVGDLCQVLSTGRNYTGPVFEKCTDAAEFSGFTCRHYLALRGCDKDTATAAFAGAEIICGEECAVVTAPISEGALAKLLAENGIQPISDIRLI